MLENGEIWRWDMKSSISQHFLLEKYSAYRRYTIFFCGSNIISEPAICNTKSTQDVWPCGIILLADKAIPYLSLLKSFRLSPWKRLLSVPPKALNTKNTTNKDTMSSIRYSFRLLYLWLVQIDDVHPHRLGFSGRTCRPLGLPSKKAISPHEWESI